MAASARADEEGRKVFLGGLSFDAREDDLKADFGKYGELEDVQLPNGESGRHKGFAFLTYVKAEDAVDACKEHHQKEYLGREISARVVVPRGDRGGGGGGGGGGGDRGPPRGLPELSQEMSDKLEEWVSAKRKRDFETSDRIRAEMQRDGVNPEDYRPKPGGSAEEEEIDPALAAEGDGLEAEGEGEGGEGEDEELEAMKNRVKEMEDEAEQLRKIQEQVEEQMTGGSEGAGETNEDDSRSICVQQVDYSATPEELQEFFAGCGTVNRVTILCGKGGLPKGFAYIEFAEVEAVEAALALHESDFKGRTLKISPKRTNVSGYNKGKGRGKGKGKGKGKGAKGKGKGKGYGAFYKAKGRGRGYSPY